MNDFEQASHDARVLHAFGVIVNHVAQAMINGGLLDHEAERILQRSANRGPTTRPSPSTTAPNGHTRSPMILIKDLYNPEANTREPPHGNVIYIDPGVAANYLVDLDMLGVVDLEENPAYRPGGGAAEILMPDSGKQS